MRTGIAHFLISEGGATAIEYGMIASLVFLAIVGAVQSLGANVVGVMYTRIETLF